MGKIVITEEFLQQVEALQILLKNNVAGMFGGNHKTRTLGSSCEFADHRDYMEGDDITRIDWNAYARFDKLYVKQYLDERQMHTRVYIDASRSMEYGDAKKAEQALKAAALIAYLSVCEMDKVSIYTLREGEATEIIRGMVGKDAYFASIARLNEVEFSGDCCITDAILSAKVGYGDGLSVIISDFLTDNDYETAIDHLTDKKRDVMCLQVLSREELNPQIRGKVHFFDSEHAAKFYRKDINREIAKAYKQAVEFATNRIKDYCMARGGSYVLTSAEDPVGEIFLEKMVQMGVMK